MREICQSGSEGGGAQNQLVLPTPIFGDEDSVVRPCCSFAFKPLTLHVL